MNYINCPLDPAISAVVSVTTFGKTCTGLTGSTGWDGHADDERCRFNTLISGKPLDGIADRLDQLRDIDRMVVFFRIEFALHRGHEKLAGLQLTPVKLARDHG